MMTKAKSLFIFYIIFAAGQVFSMVDSHRQVNYERPNMAIFEMQLQQNQVLLFGNVENIIVNKADESEHTLKGFKYFTVKLKVDQIWSKDIIKPGPYYTFKFGTMIDDQNMLNALPVKNKEKLAIVLDTYQVNETHILKDHLLNIYEQHTNKLSGREFFISKLTKHYSQKNLSMSELQRVAFTERMRVYDLTGKGDTYRGPVVAERSIASVTSEQDSQYEEPNLHEIAHTHAKRAPNSSLNHKNEDLSVFGLLMVLVFLGIFSHFIIKYYEDQEEEI